MSNTAVVHITRSAMSKFANMQAEFFDDADDRLAVVRDMAEAQFDIYAESVCTAQGETLVFQSRDKAEVFVATFDEGDCVLDKASSLA